MSAVFEIIRRPLDTPFFRRNTDYRTVWLSEIVSQTGSQVSGVAIPVIAVVSLHATPAEVSSLFALQYVGFPLLLLLGTGRLGRFPAWKLAVAGNSINAACLVVMLGLFAGNVLVVSEMQVLAMIMSLASALEFASASTLLTYMVDASDLVTANALSIGGRAASQSFGPALGGALVSVGRGALALGLDMVSFLGCAVAYRNVGHTVKEPLSRSGVQSAHIFSSGIRSLFGDAMLARLTIGGFLLNLGGAMIASLYYVYAIRVLELSPFLVSITLSIASLFGVGAARLAKPLFRFAGVSSTARLAAVACTIAQAIVPNVPVRFGFPGLVLYEGAFTFSVVIFSIASSSYRQHVISPEHRFSGIAAGNAIGSVAIPIGAILGALFASKDGTYHAIVIGCFISGVSAVVQLLGPFRHDSIG